MKYIFRNVKDLWSLIFHLTDENIMQHRVSVALLSSISFALVSLSFLGFPFLEFYWLKFLCVFSFLMCKVLKLYCGLFSLLLLLLQEWHYFVSFYHLPRNRSIIQVVFYFSSKGLIWYQLCCPSQKQKSFFIS